MSMTLPRTQLIVQMPAMKNTGGSSTGRRLNLADQINGMIEDHPGLRLTHILPVPTFGSAVNEYVVVFDTPPLEK